MTASIELIGNAAGRIRRFAEAIQQGHEFGIDPGDHHEPWTTDFQRVATSVYELTIPWSYLVDLASAFESCADLMVTEPAPAGIARDWSLVEQYLRSASKVLRENTPETIDHPPRGAADIDPTTPPVMSFGRLAALVSAEGAARLAEAGGAVERACGQHNPCPLSEAEQDWLRRLRRGDRTLDIAVDHGYSERSLYRALSGLWRRLGVDNRTEAIALATSNDWL